MVSLTKTVDFDLYVNNDSRLIGFPHFAAEMSRRKGIGGGMERGMAAADLVREAEGNERPQAPQRPAIFSSMNSS